MADDIQPLSNKTRRTYLLVFIVLFLVCLPLAILYATGYRLGTGFGLVETGGVYITVAPSGAEVSVNGKVVGTSGFLSHSFYVDNLPPGTYAVHVGLEGDYPWYKTLVVEPRIVTDAQAFMVPSELSVRKITLGPVGIKEASTTALVTRSEYDVFAAAFAPTTTRARVDDLGNPLPDDTQSGEALYLKNGAVSLVWTRSTTTIPSALCATPHDCRFSATITHSKERITRANFFAGGVVYQAASGVYLTEADIRPTPLTVPLYPKVGVEYRIISGRLVVKDGASLYEITGI